MHLKNFSLIRRDLKVELSPAYDLLNSTIVLNSEAELALPLNGKKNRLKKDDFLYYFAEERLELLQKSIAQTTLRISKAYPRWIELIQKSFLSDNMKDKYKELLNERCNLLELT
jgi:serine/threonine-protein kinase HipA